MAAIGECANTAATVNPFSINSEAAINLQLIILIICFFEIIKLITVRSSFVSKVNTRPALFKLSHEGVSKVI